MKYLCFMAFFIKKFYQTPLIACLLFVFISSCNLGPKPLFRLLDSTSTGIDFENIITETDSFNILTNEYIFNGGGIAVSDFNQDVCIRSHYLSFEIYAVTGNRCKKLILKNVLHFQHIYSLSVFNFTSSK